MGMALTPEEQFDLFGTDKVGGEWATEAEQRWGDTDAWRESQRRTATYTKQDWAELKTESDAALRAHVEAMNSGVPATGDQAMALAERNRLLICRWFYDCSPTMHRGLADMYLSDPRMRATWDGAAPGLAQYVHDTILANANANAVAHDA